MGQRPQTRLRAASLATQPRLWQVLQRCLAELTVITGEHPERSPAEAAIAYPYWDQYWQEANRHPFGIWFGSSLAGLCLMRRLTDDRWQVAEFCVEAGYRRQGIGTAAIAQATTLCRGRGGVVLEARVHQRNAAAQTFWERAGFLAAVTDGDWVMRERRLI